MQGNSWRTRAALPRIRETERFIPELGPRGNRPPGCSSRRKLLWTIFLPCPCLLFCPRLVCKHAECKQVFKEKFSVEKFAPQQGRAFILNHYYKMIWTVWFLQFQLQQFSVVKPLENHVLVAHGVKSTPNVFKPQLFHKLFVKIGQNSLYTTFKSQRTWSDVITLFLTNWRKEIDQVG